MKIKELEGCHIYEIFNEKIIIYKTAKDNIYIKHNRFKKVYSWKKMLKVAKCFKFLILQILLDKRIVKYN